MIKEEEPPKKSRQEQIDEQIARELEERYAQENQARREQIARDEEIARIHAEEELGMMISELDRSNEMINKHMEEFEASANGHIKRWKILRVREYTELYQTFEDLLKRIDKEDLDTLWKMAQELHKSGKLIDDKEKEIWVKLKRLYDPDPTDQLWSILRHMHKPREWKLYDISGVHHVVTGKGYELFMLIEKDYPLTKGLATLMISNKLQMDRLTERAIELINKIYKIANRSTR
ncbi:hypothetical protein Tco_0672804 [Tanacetum coccineum]